MDAHFVPNLTFGAEDHQAPAPADRAAVRRAPDGRRARPVPRRVPRGRLRLDHVPRRDRRGDRADPAPHPGGRPGGRAGGQAGHAAVRARAVPRAARHRPGHDRRARVRRPVVHEGRRQREAARGPRPAQPQGVRRRGPRRRRDQPRDRRVRRRARGRHPRRRLGAVHQGPRHGPRDPAHPGARRRGLPVHPQRRRAADPARPDGHVHLAAEAPRPAVHGRDRGRRRARSSCSAATAR